MCRVVCHWEAVSPVLKLCSPERDGEDACGVLNSFHGHGTAPAPRWAGRSARPGVKGAFEFHWGACNKGRELGAHTRVERDLLERWPEHQGPGSPEPGPPLQPPLGAPRKLCRRIPCLFAYLSGHIGRVGRGQEAGSWATSCLLPSPKEPEELSDMAVRGGGLSR